VGRLKGESGPWMMVGMRARTIVVAPFVVVVLSACGNPSAPEAAWVQVAEHTRCEALSPQYCSGAFGFTVQSDGRFTVGPSDSGVSLAGSLTASERAELSTDAARVSQSLTMSAVCDPAPGVAGVGDRVDFTDSRAGAVPVYEVGIGNVCYRAGRDEASKLHTDLVALMAKYYPRPFPPT
jgi:hypothetical protein